MIEVFFFFLPTVTGWAHVVCALYIPEVEFANVSTMEPIVLQSVPQDRYNKVTIAKMFEGVCLLHLSPSDLIFEYLPI